MNFIEFKDWVLALEEQPPSLTQWWELKARLDAVEAPTASSSPATPLAAAVPSPKPAALPAPQAEGFGGMGGRLLSAASKPGDLDIEDCPPPSLDSDVVDRMGATAAEAVHVLRARKQRPAAKRAATP
jgi:hypothetical protein